MQKGTHTPGPWEVKDIGLFTCKVIAPPHRHPQSAELGVEIQSNYVVAYIACPTHEQQAANARLIAAAPELLEACNHALANIQGCLDGNDIPSLVIRDNLRVAIAKAEQK